VKSSSADVQLVSVFVDDVHRYCRLYVLYKLLL